MDCSSSQTISVPGSRPVQLSWAGAVLPEMTPSGAAWIAGENGASKQSRRMIELKGTSQPETLWGRIVFWSLAVVLYIPFRILGLMLLAAFAILRAKFRCTQLIRGYLAARRSKPSLPIDHAE